MKSRVLLAIALFACGHARAQQAVGVDFFGSTDADDTEVAKAGATAAEAEAKKAMLDFDRYKRLHEQSKVSDNEFEARDVQNTQAKAAIRKLSPALLKGQPWPKSFAQIQKELKQ